MSTATPHSSAVRVDPAKTLNRLTRKAGAPRAHGYMVSAENELELDPDRSTMVRVAPADGRARIIRYQRASGLLGKLGYRRTRRK